MKPVLPCLIVFAFLTSCLPSTAAPSAPASFRSLQFLIGDWKGFLGGSVNGSGNGAAVESFHWDLQKNVIVNHLSSAYPAENGKPAYTYDSLLVISKDPTGGGISGDDYDSVSDVIRYAYVPSDTPNTAVFVSKSDPAEPNYRFKLTYKLTDANTCAIEFSILMSGKSKQFVPYATGIIVRTPSGMAGKKHRGIGSL